MDGQNEIKEIDRLILKYLEGEASKDEKIALYRWIELSEENKTHFKEAQELWLSTQAILAPKEDTEKALRRFRSKIKNYNRRGKTFRKPLAPAFPAAAKSSAGCSDHSSWWHIRCRPGCISCLPRPKARSWCSGRPSARWKCPSCCRSRRCGPKRWRQRSRWPAPHPECTGSCTAGKLRPWCSRKKSRPGSSCPAGSACR